MSRHSSRRVTPTRRRAAVASIGGIAVAIALAGAFSPHHRDSASALVTSSLTVSATDDAYASYDAPHAVRGSSVKLVASSQAGNRKIIFLKFAVRNLPTSLSSAHATLTLRRDLHHLPVSTLAVHSVSSSAWSEGTLSAATAPSVGATLDTAAASGAVSTVTFDLGSRVSRNGTYSVAVTSSNTKDTARFLSTEAGGGPRLTVTYVAAPKKPKPEPSTTSPAPDPTTTSPAPDPSTTSPAPDPTTTSPAPDPTTTSPAPDPSCALSAKLVPSCGVLFGGWVTSFGGSTLLESVNAYEAGTNTRLAIVHDYRRPGQVMSPPDVAIATRPNTYLQMNWKPAFKWADADGSNATVNANIDAMARSVKAIAPKKLFIAVFHEPENDVSGGASGCTYYKGSAGTPADYRAMWRNVRARFDALGVTNVVWVMNYMGYPGWDCMVDDLWPGNDLVDWIFFESYSNEKGSFVQQTAATYNLLTSNSNATHDYLSKPWGIGEFGSYAASSDVEHAYYDGIKQALDANTFPKIKLLSVYDSLGTLGDNRVRYNYSSGLDLTELQHYLALAKDARANEVFK
jgi:hypothetical protein